MVKTKRSIFVIVIVLILAAVLGSGVAKARTAPPPGTLWQKDCPDFGSVFVEELAPHGATVAYCTLFNESVDSGKAGDPPPGLLWKAECPDYATIYTTPLPGGATHVYCTRLG